MTNIYYNPHTRDFDLSITVNEWKEILCLPKIQNNPRILSALEKWYIAPNYTSSCKALAEQYGQHPNFYSVQNKMLGIYAVRHLNRFRLIGNNGKETYWGVAWIELGQEKTPFILQLRPELVAAINELCLFPQDKADAVNQYL